MPVVLTPASMKQTLAKIRDPKTTWTGLKLLRLDKTDRATRLCAHASFVRGTQHDDRKITWDGTPRDAGRPYILERLETQGFEPVREIPTADRRPNCSYPLPRQVTMRFTEMLLGDGRRPTIQTPGDADTEQFVEAALAQSKFWDVAAEARDRTGACGSVAISWGVIDGKLSPDVHHAKDLWVRSWARGTEWKPLEVVEQRLVEAERQGEDGALCTEKVWRTRAWDTQYEYRFKDVPEDYGSDKERDGEGILELEATTEHKAGCCPIIWYQNTRNTDAPDGDPDNDGAYELGDRIDRSQSMLVRATIANTDPTLHISDTRQGQRHVGTPAKGHGHVIRTSEQGKASLLESSGASMENSRATIFMLRDEYLQTVRCVIVDPETAGTYKSGEALKLLWRAMNAAAARRRVPLSDVIEQSIAIVLALARAHGVGCAELGVKGGILLKPRVTSDEDGDDVEIHPHRLGPSSFVTISWPPFHDPTPSELLATGQMLSTATGGKPVLSQATGVAVMGRALGLPNPKQELERIEHEREANMETMSKAMFGAEQEKQDEEAGEDEDGPAEDKAGPPKPEPDEDE